jgi:hypothetical protein
MCVDLGMRMGSSEVMLKERTEQNETKSIQILKGTGIDWREGRFVSNWYMDQSVKIKLETRSVMELDKKCHGTGQGCCISPILFKMYSEYTTKQALEKFGDFKEGGQVIPNVKYADNPVLQTKEETVLQGVIGRQIKIGRQTDRQIDRQMTDRQMIDRHDRQTDDRQADR